eukprot:TRINITY_DN68392_c0_g1_i1.p1 TRINITY_DN68392_c0_g1~~TRINITY_DN68392_c0_g1_i1.p1  ORF type:complete len:536 (+),score=33.05 TRINITY_DN68392_c0_g1_i1:38-1645(+)
MPGLDLRSFCCVALLFCSSLSFAWEKENNYDRWTCPKVGRHHGHLDCHERCTSNRDCARNEMCCSNGCGLECKVAVPIGGCGAGCEDMKCHINQDLESCCHDCKPGWVKDGCSCKEPCPSGCTDCNVHRGEVCCTDCADGYEKIGCHCAQETECPRGCGECFPYQEGICCSECQMGWTKQGCKCLPPLVSYIHNECPSGCSDCKRWHGETCCTECEYGYDISGCSCVAKPNCPSGCSNSCQRMMGRLCCQECEAGYERYGCDCLPPPKCPAGCTTEKGGSCYRVEEGGVCCTQCELGYDFDGCLCRPRPPCEAGCKQCRFTDIAQSCCLICEEGKVRQGCNCVDPPECQIASDCPMAPEDKCRMPMCIRGKCMPMDLNCDDGDICTYDSCYKGSCMHEPVQTPFCLSREGNGGKCRTVNGHECVESFNWGGALYTGCTSAGNKGTPWCATKTDGSGNFEEPYWDACEWGCSVQCTGFNPADRSQFAPCAGSTCTVDMSLPITHEDWGIATCISASDPTQKLYCLDDCPRTVVGGN